MSPSSLLRNAAPRCRSLWLVSALTLGCSGVIGAGDDGTAPSGTEEEPMRTPRPGPGDGVLPGAPPGVPMAPGMPGELPPAIARETTRFARLSHAQWENSVRTLFYLDQNSGLSADFLRDPIAGFDNSGSILRITPDLWDDYQRGAEAVADLVTKSPARLAKLIPPGAPTDPAGQARVFIETLGKRAYRRPLDSAELAAYGKLFSDAPMYVDAASPFAAGASLVIRAMLQSPFFLYRTELGTQAEGGRVLLSDWELASKLSFALTNGMPDDALFAAAAAKKLQTRAGLEAEAKRLLDSPAAIEMVDSFHTQHLQIPRYEGISTKDKKVYADVQAILPKLPEDTKQETISFAREIFRENLGVRELLSAPFTMVNSRLASLYGLKGSFDADTFTRAELDPLRRAGIVTQIGFLASAAYSVQPDPIHRGIFVIKQLICGVVPDAPDNVPPLPTEGTTGKSNRQIWESHTGGDACAACHSKLINPVGFAFEEFDAVGRHRTVDNGLPVDASGWYQFSTERKTFTGAAQLAKTIADSPEAAACYARAWHSYLHGQAAEAGDERDVAAVASALLAPGGSVKSAVLAMVLSNSFLTRTP